MVYLNFCGKMCVNTYFQILNQKLWKQKNVIFCMWTSCYMLQNCRCLTCDVKHKTCIASPVCTSWMYILPHRPTPIRWVLILIYGLMARHFGKTSQISSYRWVAVNMHTKNQLCDKLEFLSSLRSSCSRLTLLGQYNWTLSSSSLHGHDKESLCIVTSPLIPE